MKTRRLRLFRPRWTLGTMLLVVGWSAVVVWLNVGYRRHTRMMYVTEWGAGSRGVEYGFPATYAQQPNATWDSSQPILRRLCAADIINYWALAANAAMGMLAVAGLTCGSRYLLLRIVSYRPQLSLRAILVIIAVLAVPLALMGSGNRELSELGLQLAPHLLFGCIGYLLGGWRGMLMGVVMAFVAICLLLFLAVLSHPHP